jgi:hypothetical protein
VIEVTMQMPSWNALFGGSTTLIALTQAYNNLNYPLMQLAVVLAGCAMSAFNAGFPTWAGSIFVACVILAIFGNKILAVVDTSDWVPSYVPNFSVCCFLLFVIFVACLFYQNAQFKAWFNSYVRAIFDLAKTDFKFRKNLMIAVFFMFGFFVLIFWVNVGWLGVIKYLCTLLELSLRTLFLVCVEVVIIIGCILHLFPSMHIRHSLWVRWHWFLCHFGLTLVMSFMGYYPTVCWVIFVIACILLLMVLCVSDRQICTYAKWYPILPFTYLLNHYKLHQVVMSAAQYEANTNDYNRIIGVTSPSLTLFNNLYTDFAESGKNKYNYVEKWFKIQFSSSKSESLIRKFTPDQDVSALIRSCITIGLYLQPFLFSILWLFVPSTGGSTQELDVQITWSNYCMQWASGWWFSKQQCYVVPRNINLQYEFNTWFFGQWKSLQPAKVSVSTYGFEIKVTTEYGSSDFLQDVARGPDSRTGTWPTWYAEQIKHMIDKVPDRTVYIHRPFKTFPFKTFLWQVGQNMTSLQQALHAFDDKCTTLCHCDRVSCPLRCQITCAALSAQLKEESCPLYEHALSDKESDNDSVNDDGLIQDEPDEDEDDSDTRIVFAVKSRAVKPQ